jgi:hypothetical protein
MPLPRGSAHHFYHPIGSVVLRRQHGAQYAWVKIADPDVWRKQADVTWEVSNGRALAPGEAVHHINGDKLDDTPDNLVALTSGRHTSEHRPERTRGTDWAQRTWTTRRARYGPTGRARDARTIGDAT